MEACFAIIQTTENIVPETRNMLHGPGYTVIAVLRTTNQTENIEIQLLGLCGWADKKSGYKIFYSCVEA